MQSEWIMFQLGMRKKTKKLQKQKKKATKKTKPRQAKRN